MESVRVGRRVDLVPVSPILSLVRGPFEDSEVLLRARTLDFIFSEFFALADIFKLKTGDDP